MVSSRRMALGLTALVLAAGCGGTRAERPHSELAEAERSLQAELEQAADHLGMPADPGERVAPTRCDDGPRQDVTSGYRVRLRLSSAETDALLRSAAGFWRRRGRSVRVVEGRFPAVFATVDPGWTFALQLFPDRGEAMLSGGTPCLPDPQA
jgi:hypothetical protein